jgi:hypothetical protein
LPWLREVPSVNAALRLVIFIFWFEPPRNIAASPHSSGIAVRKMAYLLAQEEPK